MGSSTGREGIAGVVNELLIQLQSFDTPTASVRMAGAFIDKTGAVRDVHVLKPLPNGLSEAAADAVRQWRFQPATRRGQPVGVLFNLTVNFKLVEETPRPPAQ